MAHVRRHLAALTAFSVVSLVGVAATPGNASSPVETAAEATTSAFAPQLVTVKTPTPADKARLQSLGLDLTEHAGHDYVEVVLHSQAEKDSLRAAGLEHTVRIENMLARQLERIALDEDFAAATAVSPLPSGRDGYRVLEDFGTEIDQLAADNPTLAKRISIGESVEGRELTGIEIGRDVTAPEDGRPVFLMFGAHHAREWPSAELPMEFAHDLVQAYTQAGHPEHARVKRLLDAGRIIIVPVSNPDGYDASRTSGDIVDFREIDNGGTITILGTPGNAYKRKNCRFVDGETQPAGTCAAPPSPGGFALGVDLNRNYGALWGGPGASEVPADPTYHGPAPFSEPETQAIRSLISSRQVTTLISNHTFSNLILRPVGVNPATVLPDGSPAGFSPDECFTGSTGKDIGMQALGEKMAAQNGYSNQFGWELYDTTGTTEDYSYNATGGYGYTFELGPNEFHPPFEQVVGEYTGDNEAAQGVTADSAPDLTTEAADDCGGDSHQHEADEVGGGNRTAFLLAFENAIDTATHSQITGSAPAGTTIGVERTGVFPLWDGSTVADTVQTAMTVGEDGAFTYHVNPSTRPFVQSRRANVLGEPREELATSGTAAPFDSSDTPYVLTAPADVLKATVRAQQPAGADSLKAYDLVLLDTEENVLAEARGFASENTVTWTGPDGTGVPAGEYVLRVEAGVPLVPAYELEAAAFDIVSDQTEGQVETWAFTCTSGTTTQEKDVVVERGQTVDVGQVCGAAAVPGTDGPATPGTGTPTTPGTNQPAAPTARDLDAACPPDRVPDNSHRDHDGNTHDRAIACVVWWEIAQGRTAEAYEPRVDVTREQMASFVARLITKSGGTLPANPRNAFSDDDTSFHHASINALAEAGLVNGTGGGAYSPKAAVSRAQMAKFIVNAYEHVSGRDLQQGRDWFSDDNGNVLEEFINASAQAGFTAGRNGGYQPTEPVKRDAMAAFLARPLDLLVAEGTTPPKQ